MPLGFLVVDFPMCEGAVEFVQQGQAAIGIAASRLRIESCLRVEVGQGHAGPLIDQFVEAHAVAFRQQS